MNTELSIDLLAIASKELVDCQKIHPASKFFLKWTIDQVAEYLKREMRTSAEEIRRVARRFGIDKVIVTPFHFRNGVELLAVRAYGKRSMEFIKYFGFQIIPEDIRNGNLSNLNEYEKICGVLLYDKND